MYINEHTLVNAKDAGNGYHGRCAHCGVALVTDLGYCSWDNLKCIDRLPINEEDFPKKVISFIKFNGMHWDKEQKLFIKPYSDRIYTLEEIGKKLNLI